MSRFKKDIIQTMSQLSEKDFEGALPYLMLTAKCESVFRDLMVIRWHRRFPKPKGRHRYEVTREKSFGAKVDVAILSLNSGTPVAILEMKYVATPTRVIHFLGALANDLKRAKSKIGTRFRRANPGYFGLLLAREAHEVQSGSADGFDKIIKYKPLSTLQRKKLPDIYENVLHEAKTVGLKIRHKDFSSLGIDLGCKVGLQWWLFCLHPHDDTSN